MTANSSTANAKPARTALAAAPRCLRKMTWTSPTARPPPQTKSSRSTQLQRRSVAAGPAPSATRSAAPPVPTSAYRPSTRASKLCWQACSEGTISIS
ncbi:hypothetical protein BC938DRAFT_473510, partial [Jimgerdemannia flammicorona]